MSMNNNAQTKPGAYIVATVDVIDPAIYKTFLDRVASVVQSFGGRTLSRGKILARGPNLADSSDEKSRFSILAFDTTAQAQAFRSSAAFKELIPLRDKGAKWTSFMVDGSVHDGS
jgi:uncharacterized protein (DUF1330 family)